MIHQKLFLSSLLLLPTLIFAQSGPIGWATENGGTTGGTGGEEVTVSNASELRDAVSASGRRVIKVRGVIQTDINVGSDKTIEGAGPGAEINGYVSLNRVNNVILRNLIIKQTSSNSSSTDVIEVSRSTNVWIDHCDISDTRRDTDGLVDIVRGSDFVTVSWCKFSYPTSQSDHRFCMLIGNTDRNDNNDSTHLAVTLHHNWWAENNRERMPRMRYGKIHSFNNYFSAQGNNYCIGAGRYAQVVVESNYFENVKDPHIFYDGESTAQIRINNDNQYINVSGDRQEGQGNSFSIPYDYTLDSGEDVKDLVMEGVGPFNSPVIPVVFPDPNGDKILSIISNKPGERYSIQGKTLLRPKGRQPVIIRQEQRPFLTITSE